MNENEHSHRCAELSPWLTKWYSWGSPIGMALGFAIFINSIGLFLLLLHWSGLIGK